MRGWIALAVLAIATARAAAGVDDDRWDVALSTGIAVLTYPSTASLRPRVIPTTPPPCPRCISSAGEGVAVSATRRFGVITRLVVRADASRHPSFGVDLRGVAAGAGFATQMGSLPLFAHGQALLGATRFAGPVDATAFAVHIIVGLDWGVTPDLAIGYEQSGAFFTGAQPAGDGSASLFAVHLAYRWR